MAKTKTTKVKEENKSKVESTWSKKTSKLRTLTGKKAAEIETKPQTRMVDSTGRPIEKIKRKKQC